MKRVVINASSVASGGALSILLQVCGAIERRGGRDTEYIVFCPAGAIDREYGGIRFVNVNTNLNWLGRIKWDLFGLKKAAKDLNPDCVVSLQNTGMRGFGKTPQVVYLHQPLPFSREVKWNLSRAQRSYWFYRHIYKQMIRFSIPRHGVIIVQTEWMRQAVIKDFNKKEKLVRKFRPNITSFDASGVTPFKTDGKPVFFFPTSNYPYKNMELLYKALEWLKSNGKEVKLVLTLTPDSALTERLKAAGIYHMIDFIGSVPYSEVLSRYASASALVFPSLIETFGLPLLEAAAFGLPVLAPDLPYSREVCGNYEGACFLPKNDAEAWGKAISDLADKDLVRFAPMKSGGGEWDEFLEMLKGMGK